VKLPQACLAVVLIAATGCDRVRTLADQVRKKEPGGAAVSAIAGPLVGEIPDGGFNAFTRQKGRLVIVDFHADWCGPCRQLAPVLERITREKAGLVVVGKVDVDRQRDLAATHGVKNIPDVRMFRDGRIVDQFVGLPDNDDLRRMIETHTQGLTLEALLSSEGDISTLSKPPPIRRPENEDWMPEGMRRR
jgi:thioredoxin